MDRRGTRPRAGLAAPRRGSALYRRMRRPRTAARMSQRAARRTAAPSAWTSPLACRARACSLRSEHRRRGQRAGLAAPCAARPRPMRPMKSHEQVDQGRAVARVRCETCAQGVLCTTLGETLLMSLASKMSPNAHKSRAKSALRIPSNFIALVAAWGIFAQCGGRSAGLYRSK